MVELGAVSRVQSRTRIATAKGTICQGFAFRRQCKILIGCKKPVADRVEAGCHHNAVPVHSSALFKSLVLTMPISPAAFEERRFETRRGCLVHARHLFSLAGTMMTHPSQRITLHTRHMYVLEYRTYRDSEPDEQLA